MFEQSPVRANQTEEAFEEVYSVTKKPTDFRSPDRSKNEKDHAD